MSSTISLKQVSIVHVVVVVMVVVGLDIGCEFRVGIVVVGCDCAGSIMALQRKRIVVPLQSSTSNSCNQDRIWSPCDGSLSVLVAKLGVW